MEIGNVTLRSKGINILTSSIHPKHGLLWTDGKCIFLARFKIIHNQVEHGKSVKLKEFDSVRCVQWSQTDGICYLSIAHKDYVTVWKVDGEVPRLEFKQIRKISIQIVPQGCQWNPRREVLCLLSKQQVRFFYRHGKTRGSYAIPALESGRITCGTWSKDGLKLVVCVGSALLIYSWQSIDSAIGEFETNAWNVPKLNGDITAVASMTANLFALAAEVPVSSFCMPNNVFCLSDTSCLGSSDRNGNENQIIGGHEMTNTQKLMNLKQNAEVRQLQENNHLSRLAIIHVKDDMKDPDFVTNISIKEIISPDILHFETARNILVIGSNTHPRLQLFTLTSDKELLKLANVELESHSRPKGICSIPEGLQSHINDHSMMIMLGKQVEKNNAFPSTSLESKYELWLQCFSLDQTEAPPTESRQKSVSPCANSSRSESSRTVSVSSSASSPFSSSPPQSPPQSPTDASLFATDTSRTLSKPLIEELGVSKPVDPKELKTEKVDFDSTQPKFPNSQVASHWNLNNQVKADSTAVHTEVSAESATANGFQETSFSVVTHDPPDPIPTLQMNGNTIKTDVDDVQNIEHLESELRFQNNQIAELEKRIEELKRVIDTSSCVFPTIYQSFKEPETISVIHVLDSGISIKKMFLLDHGRLKMEAIKQAFCLQTVELYVDGIPIILSANIDGYIPLKFEAKSTLFIGGLSVPSSDDTISISSLASSNIQPQSPINGNDKKTLTDLSVTGVAAAAAPATRC